MHVDEVDVLMVEDNPSEVELTLRAFEKNGLAGRVYVVRDGAEALDFIFRRRNYARLSPAIRPKVVLLDLKLPKLDGHDVLRAIKTDESTRNLPVVVLTSSREEKDIIKSYNLGANSYIVKPVDFDKFVESVSQLGLYWTVLNEFPR